LPREADIVVIGAGAAGIAAARRIVAANRKVIVIEASDRIGGRCLTDTATFDMPFDRGARWMHSPDTNPLIKPARGSAPLLITPFCENSAKVVNAPVFAFTLKTVPALMSPPSRVVPQK
jgi:phytoene dehydrogenase-like protein